MKKTISFVLLVISLFFIAFFWSNNKEVMGKSALNGDGLTKMTYSVEDRPITDISKSKIVVTVFLNYKDYDNGDVKMNHPNAFIKNASKEEVDSFSADIRSEGKKYHTQKNQEYDSLLNIKGYDEKYISTYFPVITYTFNEMDFAKKSKEISEYLNNSEYVKKAYIERINENTYVESIFSTTETAHVSKYWNSGSEYDGSGIKLGILDLGLINTDNMYVRKVENHVYEELDSYHTIHATLMAKFMATELGMAPNAALYSAQLIDSAADEIDWLVNSAVDIINMSFSESVPDGQYTSLSALCDYATSTYLVTIVACAGNCNEGNAYMGSPAVAYNSITVGAMSLKGNKFALSSYLGTGYVCKPTVMVEGENVTTSNVDIGYNGTSAPTAITTGMIAMLMTKYSDLRIHPQLVTALVIANADKMTKYTEKLYNGLYKEVGAGSFNFENIINNFNNSVLITRDNTGKGHAYVGTVTLKPGQTIRMASCTLATLANDVMRYANLQFTSYYLRIFNDDTNLFVTESNAIYNNVQFLEYTNNTSEDLNLELNIYQYSATIQNETGCDKVGVAYRIY